MTLFFKFLGVKVAKAITKEFVEPHRNQDTWSDTIAEDYEANAITQYALIQALNYNELSRVINYKSVYEVWNDLNITHEGTLQVKRSKSNMLRSENENFYMLDNESIDEMLTGFTKITNRLSSLGDSIDNNQKVRKMI